MKIRIFTVGLLFLPVFGFAASNFKKLHVADLDKLLAQPTPQMSIYDVNTPTTREKVGIIPGAKLIHDASEYSIAELLPADKSAKLIFYCSNTMCTASHTAAERAIKAGYKDVSVMVDGIFGWRDAGKKLEVKRTAQELKPKEVSELVRKGTAVIVDVREGEERLEIIENEKWSPMSKMSDPANWTAFVKDLPKDKLIVLHCAVGARSKKVAERLAAEGVRSAYFKGTDQWKSDGLPVKTGPAL